MDQPLLAYYCVKVINLSRMPEKARLTVCTIKHRKIIPSNELDEGSDIAKEKRNFGSKDKAGVNRLCAG